MKNHWIVLAVLACVLLAPAAAQPPAPGAGITGIANVALRVSDLDREIAFLGKLGYEESFAIPGAGKTLGVFVKINDRQFINLYPKTEASQPLGWMHISYEAGDVKTLVKYYDSLGIKAPAPRKTASGNLASSINDPDGRVTEFTEYLPGSRHTLDQGQHLGSNRVSAELLGVDLPENNLAAEKEFYVQLGFEAEDGDNGVHLSTPGASDLRIELRAAHPGSQPQLLFAVPDARKAADRLRGAGLSPERDRMIVFVQDPDGNLFVFLETGSGHKRGLEFWKH